ncbi:MAG: hypothetical protein SPG48_05570 [Treponema sp.]|nr:hypothetical protein [Treponema sp.]
MPTIAQHIDEIRNLDVGNHTIRDIKKKNWDWLNFPEKDALYGAIFVNDVINLSRAEVKAETDIKTKIMKVLMWGYKKTNGSLRPQYFDSIVNHLNVLESVFAEIQNKNLNAAEINDVFDRFRAVKGLGISTYTKLLYFFNVSFEGKKCLILDKWVLKSLNYFDEFAGTDWQKTEVCYLTYLNKIDELAGLHNVSPEQLERFLFGYRA